MLLRRRTDLGRGLWAEGTVVVGRIVEAEQGAVVAVAVELEPAAAGEKAGTAEPETVAAIQEIGTADARVVSPVEPEVRWVKELMPEEDRLRVRRSVVKITARRAKPI